MEFEAAILRTIAIKVVDIFGNETTGTVNMDLTKISTNTNTTTTSIDIHSIKHV
jgi:hypothetical protein